MSILTVKDFALLVNAKDGTIRQHINRKLLVRNKKGLIDTDNPVNSRYILERSNKNNLFNQENVTPQSETSTKENKNSGQVATQREYLELDLRTKKATAEAKENEAELKRIQLEKMAGNLLPIELVETIFTINIQGIFKTFEGELENIASIFVEVLGGDRKDLADIIGKQREVLAVAIQKAKEDAEIEIENAVNEYQEVRSRGERK